MRHIIKKCVHRLLSLDMKMDFTFSFLKNLSKDQQYSIQIFRKVNHINFVQFFAKDNYNFSKIFSNIFEMLKNKIHIGIDYCFALPFKVNFD